MISTWLIFVLSCIFCIIGGGLLFFNNEITTGIGLSIIAAFIFYIPLQFIPSLVSDYKKKSAQATAYRKLQLLLVNLDGFFVSVYNKVKNAEDEKIEKTMTADKFYSPEFILPILKNFDLRQASDISTIEGGNLTYFQSLSSSWNQILKLSNTLIQMPIVQEDTQLLYDISYLADDSSLSDIFKIAHMVDVSQFDLSCYLSLNQIGERCQVEMYRDLVSLHKITSEWYRKLKKCKKVSGIVYPPYFLEPKPTLSDRIKTSKFGKGCASVINGVKTKMKKIKKPSKLTVFKVLITIISLVGVIIGYFATRFFNIPENSIGADIFTIIFNLCIGLFSAMLLVWFIDEINNRIQEKQAKKRELSLIKRTYKNLEEYLNDYEYAYYCVCTPMEMRNFVDVKMPDKFCMKDIRDLHTITCQVKDGLFTSSIEAFIRIENELRHEFGLIIKNHDYLYNPVILDLMTDFIRISKKYDGAARILDIPDEIKKQVYQYLSDGTADNFYAQVLEGTEGAGNVMHPYVFLYQLMNDERQIIIKYKDEISKLQ